jgi:hypothetical protein
MLQTLFSSGLQGSYCRNAMDPNKDGNMDISDPIGILSFLFLGIHRPADPFPDCGTAEDATPESCPPHTTPCGSP